MSEKYIRTNKNSFNIIKSSINYGKFTSMEDAKFVRDELVKNNWDLNSIDEIYEVNGYYLVFKVIDDKIHLITKFTKKPSQKTIDKLYKKHLRNPNNSKYGLNIMKFFDTFIIKKRIAGDDYIFGCYDRLEDAEFVRNFLMDNQWNVAEFSQIEYDEETGMYRVCEVIDDRVYILDSFKDKSDIDLDRCHEEFLSKITKHKLGFASYPHLDELAASLHDLEEKFNIKPKDDVWNFKDTENPLNDIIFTLTPFQKSVYDAVDNSTFDEIKKSLIRFKSKNFDEKVRKNLDDLISLGLICKNENYYMHKNQK